MAEVTLARRPPLEDLAKPGRYGSSAGEPPVVISPRNGIAMVQIAAFPGKEAEFREVCRRVSGVEPSPEPKRVTAGGLAFVGMGPHEWLALADGDAAKAVLKDLGAQLSGIGSFIEQSDGKVVVRLAGQRARGVLAKGCMLDLDRRVFKPGDAAITQVALIPCQLWLLDESPSFELAVPSSYAESFWSWLVTSAAEFGYEVTPPL